MGQLASCFAGALLGCCCREVETLIEEQVEQALRRELALIREEAAACSRGWPCQRSGCL